MEDSSASTYPQLNLLARDMGLDGAGREIVRGVRCCPDGSMVALVSEL